ncbi:CmpA/NrtA family ABC transporter substrate-binding protein [Parvularcula sp. LCG005]|uniref:CmpA/NrtA family ABC transporter substrate-binding protein n=1 Tax=Parvularcula sp. LCG005 TaxID=3078805 RepID=UPI0029424495|nr:CmpA/NrtA family ABC transporter substrate-binding protein [Parvularcula sp. LCG005]WOI52197.1 CmpA/NrtA family ABC transporter substrate-binding protein [Parvularcula sp. LCG005]
MTDKIRLGFIPLSDASPLVLAKEMGLFADEGLDVELRKERSWALIRDKVAYGELDGAHMLAPMVVASAFGLAPIPTSFATGFAFNLNGNGITVSNRLYEEISRLRPFEPGRPPTAEGLRMVASERFRAGKPPLTLAMVYPFSAHNYLLRYWLADAGLHPDRDVRLIVVPPPEMVRACEAGEIDGYCVGEPWNTVAVDRGVGRQILFGRDIWSAAPEKVLGVRRDWLDEHHDTHQALLRALLKAVQLLKTSDGQRAAAELLALPEYVAQPAELILPSLSGNAVQPTSGERIAVPDYTVYDAGTASFPWLSKAAWLAVQMVRWGQLKSAGDVLTTLRPAFRTDLFRLAANALNIAVPDQDIQVEGGTETNRLLDRSVFHSASPMIYLEQFARHSVREPLDEVFSA